MTKDTRIMILGAVVAIGIIALSIITTIKSGENRRLGYENKELVQEIQILKEQLGATADAVLRFSIANYQLKQNIKDLTAQRDKLLIIDEVYQDIQLLDAPLLPDFKLHIVKEGDWLSKLAITYYKDVDSWWLIWVANNSIISNPNLIYPGQVLVIPLWKIVG